MHFIKYSIASLVILLTHNANAVDLTSRLGLGYSQQMGAIDVPMITAHYYPNSRFALSGALGIDTQRDDSKFGALFKLRRIIFTENQLNFYMGAGAGYSTHEEAVVGSTPARFEDKSNFELSALLGAEFFFTGLDSLAFMFETGIGVVTGDGGSRFRTIGDTPFMAGVVFYF